MARIFQLPKQTPLDGGAVSPGALATFYLTGTTTLTNTYTDDALTTPHANPVVADSAGVFATIYLDPLIDYKLKLEDSTTALIYTVDPVMDTLTAAQIGFSLYPRTAAEISAGVTPTNFQYEPGNVLRYGADPTGAVSSAAAFQAAHDGLGSRGGLIRVPAGDYYLPTTVTFTVPIKMVGDGTSIKNDLGASRLITDGSNFIFTITPSPVNVSYEFHSLLFQDTGTTSAGGITFTAGSARHLFSMCSFEDFNVGIGIKLNLAIIYTAQACNFVACLIGIDSVSSTGVIIGCHFAKPAADTVPNNIGIYHRTSNQIFVDNSYFDAMSTGVKIEDTGQSQIQGRFEGCDGAIHLIDSDTNIVQGSYFQTCVDYHVKIEHDDAANAPTRNFIGPNKHASTLSETEIVYDDTAERDIFINEPSIGIMTFNRAGATEEPRIVVRKNQRSAGVGAGFEAYSSTSTTDPTASPVRGVLLAEWNTGEGPKVRVGSITGHDVEVIVNDVAMAQFDDSATATHTRFLIYDVDNGTLERVTVGAADSGGANFKVLRIPN